MGWLRGWLRKGSSRRRRIIVAVAGLFIVAAAFLLLALPLRGVPGEAEAAHAELTAAQAALQAGDVTSARAHVGQAREHVEGALEGAESFGGDVWSRIPFLGTPVADARHLVQALDDVTAVAEIGVDLYPSVAGKRATLFRDGQVTQKILAPVLAGTREAGAHLMAAQSELEQVQGTTPFIGGRIAARRDQAAQQVTPLTEGFVKLEPLLDELPAFLGFEGKRKYLTAMLNPSELRFSGGAALAFAPMSWDEGKLTMGKAIPMVQDPRLVAFHRWPQVKGNVFHVSNARVANSTFAPSWSVSGEELLRAWRSATGDRYDGLVAVDVVTLAKVLEATGPTAIPGVGVLNGSNLTKTLIGSYDDYYPDPTAQDQTFGDVTVALQTRLFSGGGYVSKGLALKKAADGRHLALYVRDPDVQAGFAALGLDGDLTEPTGDYVGAFTQSTTASKAAYYQRRSLELEVDLAEDGTASNRLDVILHNDTPPYAVPGADAPPGVSTEPFRSYYTRWAGVGVSVFLPGNAKVSRFVLGAKPWEGRAQMFYGHSFVSDQTLLRPGASVKLHAAYSVPGAATADDSGELVYRLAMDPQGTVNPASARVTVHLPDGYRASKLPEGWSAQGTTLTFQTDALNTTKDWKIPLGSD